MLRALEEYSQNFIPQFTAAGFFQIGRRSIIGLLSTVTTYFIVVVQFDVTDRYNGRNNTIK